MKADTLITITVRVSATVQCEEGGKSIYPRVLPDAIVHIGPQMPLSLGVCHHDVQVHAVRALEDAARRLVQGDDPMQIHDQGVR